MRHLALVVLVVLCIAAAPAQAETKAAPDGFGPIKFGMSKEEAWEAIGGEGEWTADDELTYTLEVSDWALYESEITVVQWFWGGKAASSRSVLTSQRKDDVVCLEYLNAVVSDIMHIYGKPPVRMETRPDRRLDRSQDYYTFVFDDSISVVVTFNQYFPVLDKDTYCDLVVNYRYIGANRPGLPF